MRCHILNRLVIEGRADSDFHRAVLLTSDGILPEFDPASHCRRRRRAGADAWSHQYDAGRLAEPIAELDAVARAVTVCRDRHHDARGLGDGTLTADGGQRHGSRVGALPRNLCAPGHTGTRSKRDVLVHFYEVGFPLRRSIRTAEAAILIYPPSPAGTKLAFRLNRQTGHSGVHAVALPSGLR